MGEDSLGRPKDFLLLNLLTRLTVLAMNPRQTDSTGILFYVHLVPPSRTDLNFAFEGLLYTGCQCLNRSLGRLRDEPSVSFVRFTAALILPDLLPLVALRYTPNQAFSYGWSTAKEF